MHASEPEHSKDNHVWPIAIDNTMAWLQAQGGPYRGRPKPHLGS